MPEKEIYLDMQIWRRNSINYFEYAYNLMNKGKKKNGMYLGIKR